jgi:hypothetical protein
MWDDGYDEHYTYLIPQLVSRAIACALAVGAVDLPGYLTRARVRGLHDIPRNWSRSSITWMRYEALTAVGAERYV